ncbi:hypothetical protein DOTSEDRAFT_172972 [Dothistroma septosporum NZE10]|uniref:DUF7704 domain-containing protein n=1 Tax=Dothistroma septosporum (strain NZE10 / CBS 128990) TaxID=675120 RepID=N1PQG9_DOTSN|nr:hypothetical protein DOTSEDRAFT_172972 [Dothistroma septosporum NZE10]
MSPSRSNIPPFYRLWFTTVDPALWLFGAFTTLTKPASVLNALAPDHAGSFSPGVPPIAFLLQQSAGARMMCAFTDIFLLRRTNEVPVWKTQQASILCYNLVSLGSMLWSWKQQGRLSLDVLGSGDLIHFASVVVLAAIRAAFCAGIGLREDGDAWKRR